MQPNDLHNQVAKIEEDMMNAGYPSENDGGDVQVTNALPSTTFSDAACGCFTCFFCPNILQIRTITRQVVSVSALKGEGLDDLLEAVNLQTEIMELTADATKPGEAYVAVQLSLFDSPDDDSSSSYYYDDDDHHHRDAFLL